MIVDSFRIALKEMIVSKEYLLIMTSPLFRIIVTWILNILQFCYKSNKNNALKSVLFLLFLGPIQPPFLPYVPFDDTGAVKVSRYFNQLTFDEGQMTTEPYSWMPAAREHGCTVVCTKPFFKL